MTDLDRIDRLRKEWGDKYVEADAGVPSLRRFAGKVGRVMTINMNGRALVQFTGTNDIGWYDIDLDRLRVVATPAHERQATAGPAKPKAPPRDVHEAAEQNVRLASAEEAASELAEAVGEAPSAESKPTAKPLSTADILAAARAKKPAATGPAEKPDASTQPGGETTKPVAKKLSTEEILAAARAKKAASTAKPSPPDTHKPESESAPAKPSAKKLSTEEILAAVRAKKAATDASKAEESAKSGPDADPEAAKPARPAAKKLSTEEILALARQKKRPGESSEPGKNPPERRNSAPDFGEEET